MGLGLKLVLVPAVVWVIYTLAKIPQEILRVAVIQSAMAPMITAAILASTHGLHPRLAGMMVGVGVPVSFITLAFWYCALS